MTLSADPATDPIAIDPAPVNGEAALQEAKMEAQAVAATKQAADLKRIVEFYDSGKYPLPDVNLVSDVVAAWEAWNKRI